MHRIERTLLVTLIIISSMIIGGCGGSSQSGLVPATVQDISAAQLQTLMDGPDELVILDVRSAAEYEAVHIPGSINIPLDELSDRLDELDSRVPVACICSAGYRSSQAAEILAEADFSTVLNLEGGLRDWNGDWEPECPVCS